MTRRSDDTPAPAPEPAVDEVDEASIESFPGSDPPSFTPVSGTGAPAHPSDGGAAKSEESGAGEPAKDAER